MRNWQQLGLGLALAAVAIKLPGQPVRAQSVRRVTEVAIAKEQDGLQVTLQFASGGDRQKPQVFTTTEQNVLVANVLNARLDLGDREAVSRSNPLPGIRSVRVSQSGNDSLRVAVKGQDRAPQTQVRSQEQGSLTLSFSPGGSQPENSASAQRVF